MNSLGFKHSIELLRDLYHMRWMAIVGQLCCYAVSVVWLKMPLPLTILLSLTSFLAAVNIVTMVYFRERKTLSTKEYLFQLHVDVFVLFSLLFYTGGIHNPFAMLFLLQVVIAANALSLRHTWFFGLLVSLLYLCLYFTSVSQHNHLQHLMMNHHLSGMLLSFSLLCFLICYFVARTGAKLRSLEQKNLENEQLALLGSFAANTAHQLGTPLSSMAVIAESLQKSETSPKSQEKIALLRSQIERAGALMRSLSLKSGQEVASAGGPVKLSDFWANLVHKWKARLPDSLKVEVTDELIEALIVADQGLVMALTNIFDNALEAASKRVSLNAQVLHEELMVQIEDDGPGFSEELLLELDGPVKSVKENGLGIGIFLSRSYFNRHGGGLTLKKGKHGGALIEMRLPLKELLL